MAGQERVRIRDIAEELGLSTATVSNVIHGKTGKVSAATVRRVQELLEQRQYIPNMAGILLAQNDSKIFGVVINDHRKYEGHVLEDGFVAASINALSRETEKAGYFLMLKVTPRWQDIPQFASMWNMAGLVIIGCCEQDFQGLRDVIRVPFVIYDGDIPDGHRLVNLALDNFDGGRQMGEHLKKLGHERILYIADNDTHIDHLRFLGLRAAVPQAELLVVPMEKKEREAFYREKLAYLRGFTAVFAASDHYGADVMGFLRGEGIRIPEEMSVAGFDDSALSRQMDITTIGQDHGARAELAVSLLKKLRNQESVEPEYRLPVILIERGSTASNREVIK